MRHFLKPYSKKANLNMKWVLEKIKYHFLNNKYNNLRYNENEQVIL